MANKTPEQNFDQLLDTLRAHGFEIASWPEKSGSMLVSKNGVAVVLAAGSESATVLLQPGILVRGEIASLLDRGFQKFFQTKDFELPAMAEQLHAVHSFSEELKQLAGSISLFNESLGTTSNLYHYDRVKGREVAAPEAAYLCQQAH